MNIRAFRTALIKSAGLLLLLSTLNDPFSMAFGQGAAFTYQGHFTDAGNPANGTYDFRFRIGSDSLGNTIVSTNVFVDDLAITNGLFTVPLDFGAGVFDGSARWLEIAVRPGASAGAYTTLNPLAPVTAAPYAIRAANLSGTVASGSLAGAYGNAVTFNNAANTFAGSFSGSGGALSNVNAATLNGLAPSSFWQLGGNAGTTPGANYLGTSDGQPLEMKAGNLRVLRLEPDGSGSGAPNVIGGAPINAVDSGVFGATIAGGGVAFFLIPRPNRVRASFGTIGGGSGNTILAGSGSATIAGGQANIIADNSPFATLAGGYLNDIGTNSSYGAIGGGNNNNIADNAPYSTIAGGLSNDVGTNSNGNAIGGGLGNKIGPNSGISTIAGGQLIDIGANSGGSFIGGGNENNINNNSGGSSIVGGLLNDIGTNSEYSAIGGGFNNNITAHSPYATIAGGDGNSIGTNSSHSAIGGGGNNSVAGNSSSATIAGGNFNAIGANSPFSAIGGGSGNAIAANSGYAKIPGGLNNAATNFAFAAGLRAKANHTGAFVWGDSTNADIASTNANSVTMRASGGYRLFSNSGASAGAFLAPSGTSWGVLSDRNAKKDFAPVDSGEILAKLAALPITRWHYRWEEADATPHIGPMAQDFKAAFYPGRDDKTITTQEADGVALAAIQGLNRKLEDRSQRSEIRSQRSEVRIRKLEAENAELKETVNELKVLVQAMNHKLNGGVR